MLTNQDLTDLRELIQDDILTELLAIEDYIDSISAELLRNRICQCVVDRVNPLIEKNTKEGKCFNDTLSSH